VADGSSTTVLSASLNAISSTLRLLHPAPAAAFTSISRSRWCSWTRAPAPPSSVPSLADPSDQTVDFGRQQAVDGEYRRFLEDGTPKVSPRDQAGHCGDPRIEAAVHRSLHYPRVPRHPRGPHERSQSRHCGGRRSRDAGTRRHPYQFPERACIAPDDPNTDAIAVELSVGARLTVVNCYVPPNRRGGWDKIGSDPESGVVCVRCGLRSDWLASRVLLFVVLIVLEPPLPRLDIGWPSSGQMCRLGLRARILVTSRTAKVSWDVFSVVCQMCFDVRLVCKSRFVAWCSDGFCRFLFGIQNMPNLNVVTFNVRDCGW